MKTFGNPWLSFAAPFLILLAIFGYGQREGSDKVQSIPAFLVGCGLISTGLIRRNRRRRFLLMEIRTSDK